MKWTQRFLNSSDNGGATREVLLNSSAVSEEQPRRNAIVNYPPNRRSVSWVDEDVKAVVRRL